MYYSFRNNLKTTLINDITAEDTTISFKHLVNSTNAATRLAAWPHCGGNVGFTLTLIDNVTKELEIIRCIAVANNTETSMSYTCERGVEDTTARSFSSVNCSVEHRPTADWFMNSVQLDEFTETVDTLSSTTNTANSAATTATLAKTTADSATTLATSAGTAAASAQTTANNAITAAASAQTDANAANTAAAAAKTRADDAHTLATSATNAAATAQDTASNAATAANGASDVATAAQETADAAKSKADEVGTFISTAITYTPRQNAVPLTTSNDATLDTWVSTATASKRGLVSVGAGLAVSTDGVLTNAAPATPGFGLTQNAQGLHVTRAPRIGKPSIIVPKANAILPADTPYTVSRTPADYVTYDADAVPYPWPITLDGAAYELFFPYSTDDGAFNSSIGKGSSDTEDSVSLNLVPAVSVFNDSTSYAVTDIAAVATTRFGVQYFENTDTGDLYLLTNYAGIFKTADYGATWTAVSPLLQSSVASNIVYGNGCYVCTRTTGPYWSTDLITWNAGTAFGATYNSTNVLYVRDIGKFVFIAKATASSGATSYDMIKTSDDGATWATLWTNTVSGATCGSIAYANGAFIVGTMAGGTFKVDAFTGAVSNAVTISSGGGIVRVVADMKQNRFVAGVSGNGKVSYSTDGLGGTTWSTAATTPLAGIGDIITDGNGYTYIRSDSASNAIYVSYDLSTWTALPMSGVTAAIKAFYAKLGFLSFAVQNSATYVIRNISAPNYLRLKLRSSDIGDSEWSDVVPIYFAYPCSWSV